MALSNIFREPRREITETVVGLLIVAPLVFLDFEFSQWLISLHPSGAPPLLALMVITGLVGFVVMLLLFFICLGIHELGEKVCAGLDKMGLQLRPKIRR